LPVREINLKACTPVILKQFITQREERNEMTSLLDRPITAASDDGVRSWHAGKLWQTRAKLLMRENEIIF